MLKNTMKDRCEFVCRVGREDSKSMDGKRAWQQNKISTEKGIVACCNSRVLAIRNGENLWEIVGL